MAALNVAFFFREERSARSDFLAARDKIMRLDSRIRVHVISTDTLFDGLATAPLALRQTLTVEMSTPRWLPPFWATRLRHRRLGKLAQQGTMMEHGLPVPKWTAITPDTKLDPAEWGPYVVTKPARGMRGAYVKIGKTGKVRYKSPEDLPADHPGRRGPMIAQRFIYTGKWPSAYRVLSYLGEPLMSVRYDGRSDLAPLAAATGFGKAGGSSIIASAMGCTVSLTADEDVLALAKRCHAAFPDIPSLGIDIVRDSESGQLFVLEVNPSGNSWLLSSPGGREMQAQFGLDFYSQFDAIGQIAKATIKRARAMVK